MAVSRGTDSSVIVAPLYEEDSGGVQGLRRGGGSGPLLLSLPNP